MSLIGMFTGKDARKNAGAARAENEGQLRAGYDNNMGYQRRGYQDATGRLMPFYDNGMRGQQAYMNLLGLNGADARAGAQSAYEGWNPYLAGDMDAATKAVDRRAAATGNFNSGMAALARDRAARELGTQDFYKYAGALEGLGGQGFQAAGGLANLDMQNAGALTGIEDNFRSGNIQNTTNYYNARSQAGMGGFQNLLGLGGLIVGGMNALGPKGFGMFGAGAGKV